MLLFKIHKPTYNELERQTSTAYLIQEFSAFEMSIQQSCHILFHNTTGSLIHKQIINILDIKSQCTMKPSYDDVLLLLLGPSWIKVLFHKNYPHQIKDKLCSVRRLPAWKAYAKITGSLSSPYSSSPCVRLVKPVVYNLCMTFHTRTARYNYVLHYSIKVIFTFSDTTRKYYTH